jgi:hypothetical protein
LVTTSAFATVSQNHSSSARRNWVRRDRLLTPFTDARLEYLLSVSDDARAVERDVGQPQRRDDPIAPSVGRSEIDEQHLVLLVMNDLRERVTTAHQIGRRELTLEDRVLEMVTEPAHGLIHAA